jgi:hypothetical protein
MKSEASSRSSSCWALIAYWLASGLLLSSITTRAWGQISLEKVTIEMRSDKAGTAQLFIDTGAGFSEASSIKTSISGFSEFERLEFVFPACDVVQLRLDPSSLPGVFEIRRVICSANNILYDYPVSRIEPQNQIVRSELKDNILVIQTSSDATDPMLLLPSIKTLLTNIPSSKTSGVLPSHIHLFGLITLLSILVTFSWAIYKVSASKNRILPFALTFLWPASVYSTILGAKLLLIEHFGSDMPFWDQWRVEGSLLISPFFSGNLPWTDLFLPHNEHRILFTRLWSLLITYYNNQWDARLEMILNAFLHAQVALLLWVILWKTLESKHTTSISLLVLFAFALPFSWENILAGFQSQFYFQQGFALGVLTLGTRHQAWSKGWFLGFFFGLASLFTMAAGFLASAATVAISLLRCATRKSTFRQECPTLVAFGALVFVGLKLLRRVEGHDALKAHSVIDWITSFLKASAFPFVETPLISFFMWLPLLFITYKYFKSGREKQPNTELLLAIGGWVLLQAAASSYSRGSGGLAPASRYTDALALGPVANGAALILLCSMGITRITWRKSIFVSIWGAALFVGVLSLSISALLTDVPYRKTAYDRQSLNVKKFLRTQDYRVLSDAHSFSLPYPDTLELADYLKDPNILRLLPPSLRAPMIALNPQTKEEGFVLGGVYPTTPQAPLWPSLGSYTTQGDSAQVKWESEWINSKTRNLTMEVAGYLPNSELSLYLESKDGIQIPVHPSSVAKEAWLPINIHKPWSGPFRIVAIDLSKTTWFAFREVTEVGHLRALLDSLSMRYAYWLVLTGLFIMISLHICEFLRFKTSR